MEENKRSSTLGQIGVLRVARIGPGLFFYPDRTVLGFRRIKNIYNKKSPESRLVPT